MRFKNLQHLGIIIIAIGLLSCSAEQPNASAKEAPCEFSVQPHSTPKFATYANDLSIPYDQEALVQFMWTDLKQSECFAKQYAPVKVYRIPFTEDSGVFKDLPEAPKDIIDIWQSFEKAAVTPLKGLTTFNFEAGENEKIVKSFLLVRADSNPWHLWHEFSHFIIGTKRAEHHDQNLQIAEEKTLEKLNKELETFINNEDEFSKKIQNYFNNNHEYITKRYIDEIIIESTILSLTLQPGNTPKVSDDDIQNCLALLQYFSSFMNSHITNNLNTIERLKTIHPLTRAQIDLLDMYQDRLLFQRSSVHQIIDSSVRLINTQSAPH